MALIKCPECDKEISDKASVCPSCGCPIHEGGVENDSESKKVKTKNKYMILVVCISIAVIFVVIIGVIIGKKVKTDKADGKIVAEDIQKETYREATDLLLSGKYDEAKEMFETIADYQDVEIILEQIPWEAKTFVCIDQLKVLLKSPDSLVIYDVYYFGTEVREDAKLDDEAIAGFQELFSDDEPGAACMIHYGATNTMGGMTDSVAFFVYDKINKKYVFFGSTNTLDEDEATDEEENVVFLYNTMLDNFVIVGDVDVNRINSILKSGVYVNVHILD